jgi:hypothetical protein
MRALFVLALSLILLASFPELAWADDVYNFQFTKQAPKIDPHAASAPPPQVGAVAPVPQPNGPLEQCWIAGLGFAKVQTYSYGFDQGYSLHAGYQFSKYLGLEGQILFGQGTVYDHDRHVVGAFGGRLTPIHMRLLEWDVVDVSALIGVLTATSHVDVSKPLITIYVGYDIGLNLSPRLTLQMSAKAEEGNFDYKQVTLAALYRF